MDYAPRVPGFDRNRASAHELRRALRTLFANGDPVVMPGCTDALGARLIEQAGFGVAYATGAGLANAQFGLPDIGLISQAEYADRIATWAERQALFHLPEFTAAEAYFDAGWETR